MKKLFTIIIAVFLLNTIVSAQDTLYMCKSGAVVHKQAIADIDSIVFHNPTLPTVVVKSANGTNNSMQSQSIYNSAVNTVIVSCDNSGVKTACPSASLLPNDLTTYPKTLTIDYGTSGCSIGAYPVSGKIIANLSGKIREAGTTISITFENYSVDTITVSGTISLTVDEYSTLNKTITITDSIQNGILTTPSGTISLSTNQTIKYYFNTLYDYTDNEYEILSAATNVTALDGKSYSTEVLEMIKIQPCSGIYQITDGIYKITSPDLSFPVQIDFGDGTCDNVATVSTKISITYGNYTFDQDYSYEITLP